MFVDGAVKLCTVYFVLFYSVCQCHFSSLVGSRDPADAGSSSSISGWKLIRETQEAVDEEVGAPSISDWYIDGSGDGYYCCAGVGCCSVFLVYFVYKGVSKSGNCLLYTSRCV